MQKVGINPVSVVSGMIARGLLALALMMALAFNPVAMRLHMANAAPVIGAEMVMPEMAGVDHGTHKKSAENICPQMAPCTAVLSGLQNLEFTELFLSRLELPPGELAKSLAPAPPFHPPIA